MSLSQFKVAQALQAMIYVPSLEGADDVKCVKHALESVPGVYAITCERPKKTVTVKFSRQDDEAEFKQSLLTALERKGYNANEFREMPKLQFQITAASSQDRSPKTSSIKKK